MDFDQEKFELHALYLIISRVATVNYARVAHLMIMISVENFFYYVPLNLDMNDVTESIFHSSIYGN